MAKLLFSLLLLAALLSACGDVEESTVTSMSISPSAATVGINRSQYFSVIGRDSAGLLVTVSPAWSCPSGIGSIGASSGIFTAGSVAGTGTVVATYGSITATASVTITAGGWIGGRVVDNKGNKVPDLKVYLSGHESTYLDFTRNDYNSTPSKPKGAYLISGVPAGTYEVRTLETSVYRSASSEVTVASGETVSQDLTVFYFVDPPDLNPPDITLPTE